MEHYSSDNCERLSTYGNYSHTTKGRIWVIWDPKIIQISIRKDSRQFVHAEITWTQIKVSFLLTAVYASNSGSERRDLWEDICNLAFAINRPWIVAGDFNTTRFPDQRMGGPDRVYRELEEFNDCIEACAPKDLKTIGQVLSWNNNSQDDIRLRHMWLQDTSVYEVVEKSWGIQDRGNPMYRVVQKLNEVKRELKVWNQNVFGRIDRKVPILLQKLHKVQDMIALNRLIKILHIWRTKQGKNACKLPARMEEPMNHQNSRVQWLNLGDSNSSFFHVAMNHHCNQNSIMGITKHNGDITTDAEIIELKNLTRPVSPDEIEVVVKALDGNKAPGPNGFNGDFYQHFWYLIGGDVTKGVQYFFNKGTLLPEVNTTNIALIPKGLDAAAPDTYQPIFFCNLLYKIIVKIMTNRLSTVMDRIIGPFQSAFIKGRLIQDNILLT
ncbi:uncharacterized protein LOC143857103 [Tasmannia lanceolata]|uniref:uncharacterized protein LOC143857103 n=1 Tax=Tasmannia lanceolata TaxID=3420 RepID=UPI00406336F0